MMSTESWDDSRTFQLDYQRGKVDAYLDKVLSNQCSLLNTQDKRQGYVLHKVFD